MAGLKGNDGNIWVTDFADSSAFSQESCSAGTGALVGTPPLVWVIDDAEKSVWDVNDTFTVEVSTDGGSTWSTASTSSYTLRYTIGVVEFDSDPFGGATSNLAVRVSGSYLPRYPVAKGYETDWTISNDLLEQPQFQDDAQRRIKGQQDLDLNFGTYQVTAKNIDASGDDDGPTLREILYGEQLGAGSGQVDEIFVYQFESKAAHTDVMGAWVRMFEESASASHGDSQTRSFNAQCDVQDTAMASQPASAIEVTYA